MSNFGSKILIAVAVSVGVIVTTAPLALPLYHYHSVRQERQICGDAMKMAYCMTIGIGDSIYARCTPPCFDRDDYRIEAAYNGGEFSCRVVTTTPFLCGAFPGAPETTYYVFTSLRPGTFDINITESRGDSILHRQRYAVTVAE